MPEAGFLLLILFLGVCSLIVVALLYPSDLTTTPTTASDKDNTGSTEGNAVDAVAITGQRLS